MTPTPDFEALAQPAIRRLRAYDPGHDICALRHRFPGLIELGSNENPLGPSLAAIDAARESLACSNRYPDPLGTALKQGLATTHGLDQDQIVLGNGSHELLMMFAQVFAGPDASVLASEFGFAVYSIAARAAGAEFRAVPALPSDSAMARGHDLHAFAACVDERTRLLYLANPNNPTATWFCSQHLQDLLTQLPPTVLVIVDEAYLEYASDASLTSALPLLGQFPNLIVTRTFSKAHGLAGLRVGYACLHPSIAAVMERVRESFNVNSVGLAACAAALDDPGHLTRVRDANNLERTWLSEELRRRGILVGPSQTNFLLAEFKDSAAAIEAALIQSGIVPRPMVGYGLPQCLRLTVGTRDDNERLLAVLDGISG